MKKLFFVLLPLALLAALSSGCAAQQCVYERVALNSVTAAVNSLEEINGEHVLPLVK